MNNESFRETLRRLGAGKGDRLLLGLSGGADSMCLLQLLRAFCEEEGCFLAAAHVNHMLRGEEALGDEAFVKDVCARLGVPLYCTREDVRAKAAASGEGEEECGRRLRYAFFRSCGDFTWILTAHNLNDNAETVLWNLTRGSGLAGVCGIPEKRGNILRPLLRFSREEIEAYCRKEGLPYRIDSTNSEDTYTRNRIRRRILPELCRINPAFLQAVRRFTDSAREDEDFFQCLAENFLRGNDCNKGLNIIKLKELEPAVRRRVLRLFAEREAGVVPERRHMEQMEQMLRAGEGAVCLPGGRRIRVQGGILTACEEILASPPEPVPLRKGGLSFGQKQVTVRILSEKAGKSRVVNSLANTLVLDYDKILSNPVIRSRREGDYFRRAGRNAGKSLKKLFNEARVPPEQRALLAVLADDEGVLAVEGFGVSERAAVSGKTERILVLSIDGSWENLAESIKENRG